jgi:hypothetical protein
MPGHQCPLNPQYKSQQTSTISYRQKSTFRVFVI